MQRTNCAYVTMYQTFAMLTLFVLVQASAARSVDIREVTNADGHVVFVMHFMDPG